MLERKSGSTFSRLCSAKEYRVKLGETPDKIGHWITTAMQEDPGYLSSAVAKFCLLVDGVLNVPADTHNCIAGAGKGERIHVAGFVFMQPFVLCLFSQSFRRRESLFLNVLFQGSIFDCLR